MKINKIIKLCKTAHTVILYQDPSREFQWLSDGEAIYPLAGLPIFDEDSFCNTFDIKDSQRDKIVFRINEELPKGFDFNDSDNFETYVERLPLTVNRSVHDSVAFKTEYGIEFIDRAHLAPFADYSCNELVYSLRVNEAGQAYFAVKNGLVLLGIVLPLKVIDRSFIDDLKAFTRQVEMTFYNKEEPNGKNPQIEMQECDKDDEDV